MEHDELYVPPKSSEWVQRAGMVSRTPPPFNNTAQGQYPLYNTAQGQYPSYNTRHVEYPSYNTGQGQYPSYPSNGQYHSYHANEPIGQQQYCPYPTNGSLRQPDYSLYPATGPPPPEQVGKDKSCVR